NLQAKSLTGSIPDLSGLTALQWLYLSNNQFTGSIPSTLGNLPSLTKLYLHLNQLTGTIPSSLGNLNALTLLSVLEVLYHH
ncbi:hypothetical protein BC831DRAFT_463464, partial [Entophlyctis helioformis]